jgi:hypothetical protein
MTATADSTSTYRPMGREGRPCQSPVSTLQAQDQVGAVVALATGTTGALETEAECPAFPHLPADIQHALADFDARVADGRLPMAADGYPAIPAAAEAWVADFLRSHLPTEI